MAADEVGKGGAEKDVDNIRKILFGDQVSQMEERFNQNETAISQLRTENRNIRQALEAELTQRERSFEDLRQSLEENIRSSNRQLEERLWEKIQADHEAENQAMIIARDKLFAAFSQIMDQYLDDVRTAYGKKP